MTVPSSFEASALVDFHCHLDLYPDHLELVARCEREAVYTLAVTTTPKAWARNKQVTSPTKYVRAALGLHPQLVESRQGELAMWRDLASETRYIGEIGLDGGPRYFGSMTQQQAVFGAILDRCAELGDRILTIHSVRSVKTVMDMIEAKLPRSRGRAVMHWFTGSSSELRRAVDLGCYFSVNQAMLDGDKRRALARAIPIDRLLTETDGPFTKMGEKPSVPSDVARTVIELARMHATEPVTMARRITSNLKSLVG